MAGPCGKVTKEKSSGHVTKNRPSEPLYAASQGAFRKNNDLKYVLKFAMMTPSRPTKIRKVITKTDNRPECFTQDEALSLFIESDMTKKAYQTVRSAAKRQRVDIYPAYNELREAKRQCYPGNITVTEDSARVPLQDLLDHTALRIIQQEKDAVTELVENLPPNKELSCKLLCKWGFDGSSGQSEYKQQFSSTEKSDESLFLHHTCSLTIEI